MIANGERCWLAAWSFAATVFFLSAQVQAAGTISGQVTDADTGLGFPICVDFFDDQGGWLTSSCPSDGIYVSPELEAGTYYVATGNWMGYYDEVYDDIPCNPMCDVTIGTPLVVSDAAIEDIDFVLQPGGGNFGGQLTDAATGQGVAFTPVYVFDASGDQIGFGWANPPHGFYTTKGALETGTYFAATDPEWYFGELYDDRPCEGMACNPTTGDPISVTAGMTTPGVDFALVCYVIFADGFESGDTSAW